LTMGGAGKLGAYKLVKKQENYATRILFISSGGFILYWHFWLNY